jgi:glycosyltransferase involved in cell wall biosynthesis
MPPLVSIALCTFNGEKYLIKQLDSLVQQSYPNLEIIAVDDCSTDDTLNILKEYAARFPNFKIYQNEVNLGYKKNFEKAIQLCKGEYITLSDQDDIWMLDKIQLMVNHIKENLLLYHDSELIDESGISLNKKSSNIFNFYEGNNPDYLMLENCISGHALMFKNELTTHIIPFPEDIFHDQWIGYAAASKGNIAYLNLTLVKYRIHSSNNTDMLRKNVSYTSQKKIRDEILLRKLNSLVKFEIKTAKRLLYLLENKKTNSFYYGIKIFFFLLARINIVYYVKKKNIFSKVNYCFKYL